jgi:prevent-host-death family protein
MDDTPDHPTFPEVTTSDLSRSPRRVLDRVVRGERLIVTCHGRPLATLQPLDGVVWQPFTSSVHDIYGWPVTGASDECDKLSDAQRELLRDGVRGGRLVPARLHGRFEFVDLIRSIENMAVRGLVRKTSRGWELTGRGMVLHETLMQDIVGD